MSASDAVDPRHEALTRAEIRGSEFELERARILATVYVGDQLGQIARAVDDLSGLLETGQITIRQLLDGRPDR